MLNIRWLKAQKYQVTRACCKDQLSSPMTTEAEFAEMRLHDPKIADDVADIIAEVREQMNAAAR